MPGRRSSTVPVAAASSRRERCHFSAFQGGRRRSPHQHGPPRAPRRRAHTGAGARAGRSRAQGTTVRPWTPRGRGRPPDTQPARCDKKRRLRAATSRARGIADGVRSLDASIIGFVEPLLNPVWVFMFVGERPSVWALIGGAIIISAVIGHTLRRHYERRRQIA